MKVYKDTSFSRYEHLPLHHRRLYWLDYLERLIQYSLSDPEISSEKHDKLIDEITRVKQTINILRNEPSSRTIASAATPRTAKQKRAVSTSRTNGNKNVRSRGKRGTVQHSD